MHRSKKLLLALVCGLCASLTGCIGFGQHRVTAVASAEVQAPTPPQMVSVGAGVWVIEDHPEPIYFHSDQYWVQRGGFWFHSSVHTGGWVRVEAAPAVVVGVYRPQRHVRYHAPRTVERRTVVVVRDDDGYEEGYRHGHKDGYKKGKKKGKKKGYKKGHKHAKKHGKKKGPKYAKKKGKKKKGHKGAKGGR